MTDALTGAVSFAFDSLRLHRVEAACLPGNDASRRLLQRVGFGEEGYARQYLKINGRWQDHLLFALLDSDPPGRFSRTATGNTGG
jgi:ribosomal-protein-alanine N-acetyltransferase